MSHVFEIAPFSGIEALQEAVTGSHVVPTQLSRGPFTGTLVVKPPFYGPVLFRVSGTGGRIFRA